MNSMKEELSISDFTEMFNQAKPIFEVSTNLSFFEARIFNNLLLLYEIQKYCRITDNTEIHRYSLDLVLEKIQSELHKNIIMAKRRKIEEMCETKYYYIFLLK